LIGLAMGAKAETDLYMPGFLRNCEAIISDIPISN
jgi:hypothetical protein